MASLPQSVENILSIPIWFNKHLKTKFDVDISLAGFNCLKDLFPGNFRLGLRLGITGLGPLKVRKLGNIINKVPQDWVNCIENSTLSSVVHPCQTTNLHGGDYFLRYMGSEKIYKILIAKSTRIQTGVV